VLDGCTVQAIGIDEKKVEREDYRRLHYGSGDRGESGLFYNNGDLQKQAVSIKESPGVPPVESPDPSVAEAPPGTTRHDARPAPRSQTARSDKTDWQRRIFPHAGRQSPTQTIVRDGHIETHPLRSREFRTYLQWRHYTSTGGALSSKAIE